MWVKDGRIIRRFASSPSAESTSLAVTAAAAVDLLRPDVLDVFGALAGFNADGAGSRPNHLISGIKRHQVDIFHPG